MWDMHSTEDAGERWAVSFWGLQDTGPRLGFEEWTFTVPSFWRPKVQAETLRGWGGSFQAASCFWWLPAALALPGSGPISPVSVSRGLLLLLSYQDARPCISGPPASR